MLFCADPGRGRIPPGSHGIERRGKEEGILDKATGATSKRDRRLDLFRGLALIFIFVDHIPGNPLEWFTIRNYGLSDATEIFVFISGYSAARAYGMASDQDFLFTSARILRHCWQLYVAHILLFVIFATHAASVVSNFNTPMFAEEMNVTRFLRDPEATLIQVLLLRFRPVNMDVLPLYIVLLLAFPLILPALKRWPWPTLALSVALYLLFALIVILAWTFPSLGWLIPRQLGLWIHPIDKTALDPLRPIHFLCVGYAAARLIKPESRITQLLPLRPLVACERHSLEIFCLGTILSLLARFLVKQSGNDFLFHFVVAAVGITIMFGVASYLDWYQRREKAFTKARTGGTPCPTVCVCWLGPPW